MQLIFFCVSVLKEKPVKWTPQSPRASFCTLQPNRAFPASTHSVTHGAEIKKTQNKSSAEETQCGQTADYNQLTLLKTTDQHLIIMVVTILSTEPWSSLHSQKLPLFLSIHLEATKPDQSQNGGPHFLVHLTHQIKVINEEESRQEKEQRRDDTERKCCWMVLISLTSQQHNNNKIRHFNTFDW